MYLPPGSHRNWWKNGLDTGRWGDMEQGVEGLWAAWLKDSWASGSSQIHSLISQPQAALPGEPFIFLPLHTEAGLSPLPLRPLLAVRHPHGAASPP